MKVQKTNHIATRTFQIFLDLKTMTGSSHITNAVKKSYLSGRKISYHALQYHINKMLRMGWATKEKDGIRLISKYKLDKKIPRIDPSIGRAEFKLLLAYCKMEAGEKAQQYNLIAKKGKQYRKLPLSDPMFSYSVRGLAKLWGVSITTAHNWKYVMEDNSMIIIDHYQREFIQTITPAEYMEIMDDLPGNIWYKRGKLFRIPCDNITPILPAR